MKERFQGQWDKGMITDNRKSIKRNLNNIEHNDQEKEKKYHSSYVHEGVISTISLFDDLIKILVSLGIFSHGVFKDLGLLSYCKNIIY